MQLLEQVRALRAQRYTPAEIARSLAISKGEAARLVRAVAESGTATADADQACDEPRCWINPGWRHGLQIAGHDDWPDDAGAPAQAGDSGVALVLVAQPDGHGRLTMCSFLADTWCLGVKSAMGPKRGRFALGSWEGPSAITFGMDGKPHYINGPDEDPQRVLATLERTVGRGGFHYTVALGEADDLGDGYHYSAVLTDRNAAVPPPDATISVAG